MGEKRMSDEEFMQNYVRHNKTENRSDKYSRGKDGKGIKIGFWVFLAVVFLVVYYLFSKYYFIPQ